MNYACPAHSLVPEQNDRVCEVASDSFLHEVTAVKCLIFSGIEAALTPASRVRGLYIHSSQPRMLDLKVSLCRGPALQSYNLLFAEGWLKDGSGCACL